MKDTLRAVAQADQKSDVRLDRRSEDELWKRFSHARTAFDRKRRQHFAQLDEQRRARPRRAKEALVKEAEALQSSTDWGTDRRGVQAADGPLACGRAGPAARTTTRCGPGSAPPRTRSSPPATPVGRAGRGVRANLAVKERAAGRGRGAAAGHRPGRRQGGAARHPGPLGGRRQGAPRATSTASSAGCAPSSRRSATPRTTAGSAPTPRRGPGRESAVEQLEATIADLEAQPRQGARRRRRQARGRGHQRHRGPPAVAGAGPHGAARLRRLSAASSARPAQLVGLTILPPVDPVDVEDAVDPADRGQHVTQVRRVAHLEHEPRDAPPGRGWSARAPTGC